MFCLYEIVVLMLYVDGVLGQFYASFTRHRYNVWDNFVFWSVFLAGMGICAYLCACLCVMAHIRREAVMVRVLFNIINIQL